MVTQAAHVPPLGGANPQESGAVCFNIQLESGHSLQAHVYLCYDEPVDATPQQQECEDEQQQEGSSCSNGGGGGAATGSSELYNW